MDRVRVNIASVANTKKARKETRHNREYMIVPSATLPDGIVMNEIMYPAEEIEASYKSLERTPAPYGHPRVGNRYVSARDPEGINVGWVGAWNENVRRENGRVLLDKVIDVEIANRSEQGKAVLEAINKGEPIHTSTGLFLNMEPASGVQEYKFIARNMEFDHDAILLNEQGAGTPEQGVGIFVNSEGQEIPVINSVVEWAERDLDWAVTSVVDALERHERAGLVDRLKAVIAEAFGKMREPTPTHNGDSAMDEKRINEMAERLEKLEASVTGIGDTVAAAVTNALAPFQAQLDQIDAANKAAEDAKKKGLIDKIVNAGLLDEETAGTLALNALEALAEKTKPGRAAPIRGNGSGGNTSEKSQWADYDLNDAFEESK